MRKTTIVMETARKVVVEVAQEVVVVAEGEVAETSRPNNAKNPRSMPTTMMRGKIGTIVPAVLTLGRHAPILVPRLETIATIEIEMTKRRRAEKVAVAADVLVEGPMSPAMMRVIRAPAKEWSCRLGSMRSLAWSKPTLKITKRTSDEAVDIEVVDNEAADNEVAADAVDETRRTLNLAR